MLFPRKSNYSTIRNSDVPGVWFLENQVEKNWADAILYHMLDRKKKNITPPYAELTTIFFTYRLWFRRERIGIHAYNRKKGCKQNVICYRRIKTCSTTAKKSKAEKKQWHSSILLKHPKWHLWWSKGYELKD